MRQAAAAAPAAAVAVDPCRPPPNVPAAASRSSCACLAVSAKQHAALMPSSSAFLFYPCPTLQEPEVKASPHFRHFHAVATHSCSTAFAGCGRSPASSSCSCASNHPVLLLPQLHVMACAERRKLPALPADWHPRHLHPAGGGPGGFTGTEAACFTAPSTAYPGWSAASNSSAPADAPHSVLCTHLLASLTIRSPTTCLHVLVQDSPSPASPKYRSWLQWMVINIPQHDVPRGEVGPPSTAAGGI